MRVEDSVLAFGLCWPPPQKRVVRERLPNRRAVCKFRDRHHPTDVSNAGDALRFSKTFCKSEGPRSAVVSRRRRAVLQRGPKLYPDAGVAYDVDPGNLGSLIQKTSAAIKGRSRIVSFCCRASGAGSQEAAPPFSCCRGIERELEELWPVLRRRGSARLHQNC